MTRRKCDPDDPTSFQRCSVCLCLLVLHDNQVKPVYPWCIYTLQVQGKIGILQASKYHYKERIGSPLEVQILDPIISNG